MGRKVFCYSHAYSRGRNEQGTEHLFITKRYTGDFFLTLKTS